MSIAIALAGNPNSGKTTLFNALTGARQHVGNYPGVTVEKKQGTCVSDAGAFEVVDLPGAYSLTAYSMEEVVARDFLVNEKPAMVVNIVDAANLERNLYLSLQFMEMGLPVCIALNMMDVAKKRGVEIDIDKLSQLLGVPVVPTVARSGEGKQALLQAIAANVKTTANPPEISYGLDIDSALGEMSELINEKQFLTSTYRARWIALKYLENDNQIMEKGRLADGATHSALEEIAGKLIRHLNATLDVHPEGLIADQRYGYISAILKQNVISYTGDRNRLEMSDKIDRVLTHRLLGPVIMLAILMGLYKFTFTYSEMPVGWFEAFFGWISGLAEAALPRASVVVAVIVGQGDGVGVLVDQAGDAGRRGLDV